MQRLLLNREPLATGSAPQELPSTAPGSAQRQEGSWVRADTRGLRLLVAVSALAAVLVLGQLSYAVYDVGSTVQNVVREVDALKARVATVERAAPSEPHVAAVPAEPAAVVNSQRGEGRGLPLMPFELDEPPAETPAADAPTAGAAGEDLGKGGVLSQVAEERPEPPEAAPPLVELSGERLRECTRAQSRYFTATNAGYSKHRHAHKPFGWEPDVEWYKELLGEEGGREGCFVFDVGANKARKLSSMVQSMRSAQGGELMCNFNAYEPVPPTFQMAQERIAANFVEREQQKVRIFHNAVADKVGVMTIGYNNDGDLAASLNARSSRTNSASVQVTTVDHEVQTHAEGLKRLAVLKIDVEGSEAQALQGAHQTLQSGVVDVLIWERHPHWKGRLRLPALIAEIRTVAAYGFHVYMQNDDTVLRVDGAFWDAQLEPTKYKLDVVAVRANHGFDKYMQRRLLKDCRL